MKKYSAYFNKKSRLRKAPALTRSDLPGLAPLVSTELKGKLTELLTIQNDFYPCFDWTFPPPILSPAAPPDSIAELFSEPSVIPGRYSLYLHSPFCKTLCSFCYYAVIPGRGISQSADYVDHLVREMALYADTLKDQTCESIYFGGGTPSYLDNSLLIKVFEGIQHHFNVADDAEICIEAAPGTLPREKTALLKELGVNRLSYGIQTLDAEMLATMNRHYSVSDAIKELDAAVDLIGNINIDTMYGFEQEPEDALLKTLKTFHDIGIPSVSIYSLDTQRSEQKLKFIPPKDNAYAKKIRQFDEAREFLTGLGYRPVLQNVFTIPDRASYRHQIRRWDNLPLVSLGIAAQGYAPKRPYQNIGGIKPYYNSIDKGKPPITTVDYLSAEMELCRELTSKLRFTQVSISGMSEKYGVSVDRVFHDLIQALSELEFVTLQGDILRMTAKSAYYNNIIPMLFAPDAFKEKLLGLPEEYIEEFPVPFIMTRVGATQSADIHVTLSADPARAERRVLTDRRRTSDSAASGVPPWTGIERRHNRARRRHPTANPSIR